MCFFQASNLCFTKNVTTGTISFKNIQIPHTFQAPLSCWRSGKGKLSGYAKIDTVLSRGETLEIPPTISNSMLHPDQRRWYYPQEIFYGIDLHLLWLSYGWLKKKNQSTSQMCYIFLFIN